MELSENSFQNLLYEVFCHPVFHLSSDLRSKVRSQHVSLEVRRTRRQIFPTFLPMADTSFHEDDRDRPGEEEDGEDGETI